MLPVTTIITGSCQFRLTCQAFSRLGISRYEHGNRKSTSLRALGRFYQSTQAACIPLTSSSSQLATQKIQEDKKPFRDSSEETRKTTHYRITLFRSAIGLPKPKRDTLASLGLKKRMQTVYHRHSPDMAGLILNVKELLKVENVTEAEMKLGLKSSRRLLGDDRGYRLLYNARDLS
ncbi:hypothetical protein CROQUDRAFT_185055 [Cronartium quercuum f. sp. fusiforme G11]|uniref:Large ribosomal subunit protein uL30m n=1 Tax=Cronartium quercuum f. sp. fusiforme G11 TaxID=708437 RepID=A0A9P6ND36_9BASI|nr:hypothetical protein CROQUDRAFT_185055 [Cronartium quercuum f. sp. fusiforme G11]